MNYDHSLGRDIRMSAARRRRDAVNDRPGITPDDETRRIVGEVFAERPRYGPKQIVFYAATALKVELDLEMVRGALAEIRDRDR